MKGWLLDTNVVAALIAPNGAPSVKAWAAVQPEDRFHLSILTIGEYDKGIANLPDDHPDHSRYIGARDAIEARFAGRVLPVSDQVVRLWGGIWGRVRRDTGHPPSLIDILLAATAIQHELYFVTRNVIDVERSGAAIFNPWIQDADDYPFET